MKAVLCGYYGFGNLGDELILKAIIADFRRQNPAIELVVLSADPEKTAAMCAVKSVLRWKMGAILNSFRRADLFILGGGGLIQDQTSAWSPLYYLGLCVLAKLFGLKVVTYAMSIESVTKVVNKLGSAVVFRWMVDTITVRDFQSLEMMQAWGVKKEKIHLVPDPVLGLEVKPQMSNPGSNHILIIPRFPCPVAGSTLFFTVGGQNAFYALFQPVIEEKYFPSEFLPRLKQNFTPDQDFSEASVVLSARFHGLVLALLAGLPFVGYGDAHKVGRFCSEWGMPFLPWDSTENQVLQALAEAKELGANPKGRSILEIQVRARDTAALVLNAL